MAPRRRLSKSRRASFPLLALVLVLVAAAAGAWSVMKDLTEDPIAQNLQEISEPAHLRLLLHTIVGAGIIALTLVLAGTARFMRKWRVTNAVLMCIGVLALLAQLWVGILMIFEGHSGPICDSAMRRPDPPRWSRHHLRRTLKRQPLPNRQCFQRPYNGHRDWGNSMQREPAAHGPNPAAAAYGRCRDGKSATRNRRTGREALAAPRRQRTRTAAKLLYPFRFSVLAL